MAAGFKGQGGYIEGRARELILMQSKVSGVFRASSLRSKAQAGSNVSLCCFVLVLVTV